MKVWIINPYGNIPGEGWREYRSTMIAEALNKNGHQVTWWTSNFEHRSKSFRSTDSKLIKVNPNFNIQLIPSSSYNKHISLARIKFERQFINNLKLSAITSSEVPDIIISAEPALFISDVVVEIVKYKKAKLVIDIIDLWPELFTIIFPDGFKYFTNILFWPLYVRRRWFLKKANAIIAVAKDYLDLGLKINNTKLNEVIYWGVDVYSIKHFLNEEDNSIESNKEFQVIYAGTFGNNYDLKTIMTCALMIEKSEKRIKIILAGDGALKPYVTKFIEANRLTKTTFIGSVSPNNLSQLYRNCDVGLCSYIANSTVSMPVKAYDYLSAGLPLINSLKKDIGRFTIDHKIGIMYEAGSASSMYKAITELYNSPSLLQQLKINTLNLSKVFNKDEQYNKLTTLCESLCNE